MQPDMFEYVCSRAAAWNCPISLEGKLEQIKTHPCIGDNLEIIRRWEEARLSKFFNDEQKRAMKNHDMEYILLIDEDRRFELVPYKQIQDTARGNFLVHAFIFKS